MVNHATPARSAISPLIHHSRVNRRRNGSATGTAAGSIQTLKPIVPSSDNVAVRRWPRTNAMAVARLIIQGFTVNVKCPSVLCVSTEVTCHSTW